MLRLPAFELRQPESLPEALALLAEAGPSAALLAGGTDLLPNLKHELLAPRLVVSLSRVEELRGLRREADGSLRIGAMTPLAELAESDLVRAQAPALAQAASLVAGPQLRRRGTLGGNLLLDTRCQYYNQTYFWRSALGFCLKKDGTACHVVAGGSRCVAAASADTAPALMTLGAVLEIAGPEGRRRVALDDFFTGDGIHNRRLQAQEILVGVQVPPTGPGHRGAYGKLRERGSIDFPLLGVAVRLELAPAGEIDGADVVLTALAARPRRVSGAAARMRGVPAEGRQLEAAAAAVAEAAHRQCRTLPNVPGDHEWRGEMVRVYVRRTLLAAAQAGGPVHHV
ncbi:MAG: xanthine dehydrogenase family protein subunit M [Vicinamibacteria bacterium]